MKSEKLVKVAFESSLIVFSVLLALFLNEYREQLKEERERDRAMQLIMVELKSNLTVLKQWIPYHQQVVKNLDELLENQEQGQEINDANTIH